MLITGLNHMHMANGVLRPITANMGDVEAELTHEQAATKIAEVLVHFAAAHISTERCTITPILCLCHLPISTLKCMHQIDMKAPSLKSAGNNHSYMHVPCICISTKSGMSLHARRSHRGNCNDNHDTGVSCHMRI